MSMFLFSLSPEWLLAPVFMFLPIISMLLLNGKKKKGVEEAKLLPSPPKLPIVGNLYQLGKLPHHSLWQLSKIYGPIMFLKLGSIPTLVISSAELAKEVLKTHDIDCFNRPRSPGPKILSYNYLDIAFTAYTDYWKQMRKFFMLQLYSVKRVQVLWRVREEQIDHLISCLSQASESPVNLNEMIFSHADSIVGVFAFGKSYGGKHFKNQKFEDVLKETMVMLDSFSAEDFFPSVLGRIIDTLTGFRARLKKNFDNLDGYFQFLIDEHLDPARPKPDHDDCVDALVSKSKDHTGSFLLTNNHIKDIFVGGTDTTSVTLIWTISELTKNPRVTKKVQTEIRGCIKQKPKVEKEDLEKFKYLKMVVKETLRMHPGAPLMIPHETIRDCEIGGYNIYPQTRILVNAWAIGRDLEKRK